MADNGGSRDDNKKLGLLLSTITILKLKKAITPALKGVSDGESLLKKLKKEDEDLIMLASMDITGEALTPNNPTINTIGSPSRKPLES